MPQNSESESWSPTEDKDSSEAEEDSSKADNDLKPNLDYSLTSEDPSKPQSEKPDMPQNSEILHDLNPSQSSSFFLTEVEDSDKLHFQSSQDNESSTLRTQNEVVNQVSSSEQVAHQHPMAVGARGAVGTEASSDDGRSVNPISTEGADYAHHITTAPTGLSDLPTALQHPIVITTQGSSSGGQFLENQDVATDKLHSEQSVSKDDGYISNNAITTTKSGLKRDGVPQTENYSVEEEKAKKSKVDKASISSGQFLENQDIATDKRHSEQSVSKDDRHISNNAITTTKSDLKRDGVPQTENYSVEEEKTKKSKVDKASKSHTEYLLWIKKTHKEITETWTKYKQQSTMELRQEIIHLTKRIQQQLDEFSDSSDETIVQEQISLENEVSPNLI
jgi:hypothetical protein